MARGQRSIQAFTRISKPQIDTTPTSKKRKPVFLGSSPEPELATTSTKKRRLQQATPPDTPTKACRSAIANLALTPAPGPKSAKRKLFGPMPTPEVNTPPTSPPLSLEDSAHSDNTGCNLPSEISDLIRLNSAFLSALSLHYAHNGISSPVDIRRLTPSITKLWGTRRVLLEDIRICLGMLQDPPSRPAAGNTGPFSIFNYGGGKFCLELRATKKRTGGAVSQPFDEQQLNHLFRERVESAWINWAKSKRTPVWEHFLNQLPVATVTMTATAAANPLLMKGQKRLDEVLGPKGYREDEAQCGRSKRRRAENSSGLLDITNRGSLTVSKPCGLEKTPISGKENAKPDLISITANIRGLSLLERVKAKEIQAANSPEPLTKAELERKAALQRSEEMLVILDMLAVSKGGQRASFPLPGLIRSVQASMRSPMSKEEIERCLAVLEKEVAPRYVKVSKFGSVVGVVINRSCKPSAAEVQQRLRDSGTL